MAEIDGTYQAKVGREQGGDRFYMKEDGEFKFFDTDFTGIFVRGVLRSRKTFNTWSLASMATASTTDKTLTPAYGIVMFIDLAAAESAYVSLASAEVGDDLVFITRDNVSNAEVTIGMSGTNTASLYNLSLVRCSALKFSLSTANGSCFIRLRCFSAGVWSIIDHHQGDHSVLALAE